MGELDESVARLSNWVRTYGDLNRSHAEDIAVVLLALDGLGRERGRLRGEILSLTAELAACRQVLGRLVPGEQP